ncbi:uncharacterized protein LOC110466016 isoform X1 [Mizuhopecten yessoensis]|uniref:uncharacterized protein LOC110466016 isoform X1 n=1 Tax=Mizuhopecten yessoensis TaxID=6573 RepID=UPI000B45E7BF|nr:uncharacterized protein LOC110466016 isoform X1 [Mizuhopecten yessoensis]XP_021377932.1 uncharacterized protein LOC110466016 isoform X1 [Mizuhopecten yessoensis]XP_021377933.1 uncharacterized protein LOC110466016 isoform X1 [Mizuhopecten yessoensis]XP_021377935.1 uncharacterized protein LOC110466016 isoform X1 [Mizuhopecten yessoensis]XP_021377936.1 uncharacterized protein LOC110466016 isoform X1 [Mizuhopecten yessoensis]
MMRHFLGGDTFDTALTTYLNDLKYGVAEHNILFNKMNEQATKDGKKLPFTVKEIMDTWILQMNYPVVMVTRSEGGKLKMEQKRFLMDKHSTVPDKYNSTFGYIWKIPFSYTSSKEFDFDKDGTSITWLDGKTKDITDPRLPSPSDKDSWVIGNLQQYGVYRVTYEDNNWRALVKQLKTDHKAISTINRGQIIDDAWNLARSDQLNIEIPLEALEYLNQEMEYVVWVTAKQQLKFLDTMLSKTDAYGQFQSFMKKKVTQPYEKIKLHKPDSTHMESLFRSQIVATACSYGVEACVEDSKSLYQTWMDDPDNNPIPPDVQESVYCTAIADGGWEPWNFALEQLTKTIDVAQIALIQRTLACSREPWILRLYLNMALNSTYVRSQDTLTVIIHVSDNQIGNSMAWEFMVENWKYLRASFGGAWFSFDKLVTSLTKSFNTETELKKKRKAGLRTFIDTHPDLGTGSTAFSQAVENTKNQQKFMEKNFNTIKAWLQRVSTSIEPVIVKDVRLPRSVIPKHYELELKPDMYGVDPSTFRFYGNVKIHVDCTVSTDNITLHINKLKIKETSVKVTEEGQGQRSISVSRIGYDEERQFLIVYTNLTASTKYVLSMDFDGPLKDDMTGLYLSSYTRGNKTIYLATTQMEPTDARKAFPCFDEPAMKATFQVTLLRKPHLMSLSNMPKQSTENRTNGFLADRYKTSRKMSTYLLAFVISDFVGKTAPTKHNITYGAWARPESVSQIDMALETGKETLTFYEDFFGIAFPLPKQDMIAIPDFAAGAMENWGLITYRENSMLYKKGVSSTSDKQWTTETITHELAHQWFGDLVTMNWWDDLWLNEGFATFVQHLGADHMHPDWKMFDQFVVKELQDSMDFDGLISSHPMYAPVKNPAQINEIFDKISYSKGASIIRMMRFFIGDDTFKRGIKKYLERASYANAVHEDLWYAMGNQTLLDGHPVDVKAIMDTWTLQMNFPVVSMTRIGGGKVKVTQKRYLRNPDAKDPGRFTSKYGYRWIIPLTLTTSNNPNFDTTPSDVILFGGNEQEMSLDSTLPDNGWVLANVMQYGYYRVNYDTQNWRSLIEQLKTDHTVIHVTNRAQIINDAWALAKSGDLDLTIALDTMEYLGNELDYVPWSAAIGELSYVEEMLVRTPLYGQFKKFMHKIIEKPFMKLGLDNTNSGHMESKARSIIVSIACGNEVTDCQEEASQRFQDWKDRPDINMIDPDVKRSVLCGGISEGGADEWDFLYSQYKQSIVANERIMMLYALGCSQQPWILSRYLAMSLEPNEVRKQDADYVIRYVSGNPIGRDLTWSFMQENWSIFMERYGSGTFSFSHMISAALASFNTDLDLEQIKTFQSAHPDMGSGTRAFEQSIEKTEGNVRWMKRNYDILKSWLGKVIGTGTKTSVQDVRLPRSVLPSLYELEIFPDFYKPDPKDFTFNGTVKIHISCMEATKNITLHINKLTVDESNIKLEAVSGDAVPAIVKVTHDEERQFLILNLETDLLSLVNYTIEMTYAGPLADDMVGLYYSSYQRGGETVYMATTQLEPTDARKTFPCFDEPNMKAQFKLTVIRKQELISLSNMQIQTSETRQPGFMADHYNVSPIMSTYLVAFVVCDFAHINGTTKNGIYYGALAPKEMINQAEFALDVGIDTITLYEEYFDIKFPLKKQEMIAIPDFAAGAMENWGLITYRETAMLYEPGVSSESNKQRVTTVITHELAHQWFGNLVTLDWWDDLWLNEGFATFVEYFGADHKFPDWTYFDIFTIEQVQRAFDFDALVTSHPLFAPVANPAQINEVFDAISYSKGASVIRMMRFFVGETSFQLGIQRYLKQREYKNADHNDLWAAMEEQIQSEGRSLEVKNIMNTWILQMNYPVVTLSKVSNTELRANQKRFLTNPNATDPGRFVSPYNYTWRVPITVTYKSNATFNHTDTYWHNNKEDVITLKTPMKDGDWFIANVQQYGYYRVNYEESNWGSLTNQLKTDHKVIHTINRGQLINDAWNLANAGEVSLKIALNMIDYLQDEMDYVPWHAALVQLGYTDSMLMRTELYGDYTTAIRNLISKPFESVGLNQKKTDGHLERMLRISMSSQACGYGIEGCVETATDMFQEWMVDSGNNKIDPDVKQAVYCTGIAKGGALEWDFLYSQYKTSNNAAEKKRILYSLSCSKEPWILSKYLEMSLDGAEVKKQDAGYVIRYVSGHSIGRDLAWNFIRAKWDILLTEFGGGSFSFANIIKDITSSFNTEFDLEQLRNFKVEHPDMGSGTRAYEQAVEKTETNIQWLKQNFETVRSWLQENTHKQLEVTDVRLPRSVLPYLYELDIYPDFYKNDPKDFEFTGEVSIHVSCVQATNNITLHSHSLTIDENSIKLNTAGDTAPNVVKVSYDLERQFLILELDSDLLAGRNYSFGISFSGRLKDDMVGLYYSSYQRANNTVYMATTQLEPTDARKTFPCFDEPNMKAQFKITVTRKPEFISLSNMQIERTETKAGDLRADHYNVSPIMSTYLVAFVVCDFAHINGTTKNGIYYGALAPKELIDQARFSLEVGIDTITLYEEFFDIKFPLKKQEMIAIPDFAAGAMENWGLITYRETAMLYEPGVSSESNKQRVTTVITHELAHQWFGNLVTLDWWDDLWLNEGFATFVEYFGADNKFPDWTYFDIFTIEQVQDAFDFDALLTSHPLFASVANPDQINEVFDTISYSKGASVIRMMRFFCGDKTFQLGIQRYLKQREFKNADHNDLWAAMEEQIKNESRVLEVKNIMNTWILQMNYPVVTLSKVSNTNIRATQKRYLTNPNAVDPGRFVSPYNYTWMIPTTITFKSDVNFNQTSVDVYWHNNKVDDITLRKPMQDGDWFLANVQQFGFYRVNYDSDNWVALTNQLKTDHKIIHTINRGQLINDAWNLANSGELSLQIALDMIDYLTEELDYVPWYAALAQLGYADEMLMRTEVYGDFTTVIRNLIAKPFESVGLHKKDTDGHLERMLRISMSSQACGYGIEECVETATNMFQEWMVDPGNNKIDPDVKQAVYCAGIAEGGALEWDFLYSQYKTSNNAAEKKRILYSLSCSKEPWILRKYLDMSLDSAEVRKQDASYVIIYVSHHSIGRDIAWNFVRDKWDTLMTEFGGGSFSFASLISGVTSSFNTEYDLQQLVDFKTENPDMGSGTRAYEQALEKTGSNIQWIKKNMETIRSWLGDNKGNTLSKVLTDVRLPRSVLPSSYELQMFPNFYEADPAQFTFNGNITMYVRCVERTNNITLHAVNLDIDEQTIRLADKTGGEVTVSKVSQDNDRQFVILHLSGYLTAGRNYTLSMSFSGQLGDNMVGMYYSSYQHGNKTIYMATTKMEPTHARKAFPCFDEPNMKAKFKITLVRKPALVSLSNMPVETKGNAWRDGYVADVYQESPVMSTYLVAMIVCDFQSTSNVTKNNVTYNAWATPEKINQASFALDVGISTLNLYEDFFGIRFPLPKQDMIAIPDFAAGAMENWGLITYRETAMLYEPGVSSESNKQRVTTVITHELAHQWFGNLVTLDWWDDLWLNEGFATFVEYFGADHKFPDWKYFEIFAVDELQDAFESDALVTSHPMFAAVYNPTQIREVFDSISYSKGASIIRMMKFFVGDDVFQKGIQRYLNSRIYQNAVHDDLWMSMANVSSLGSAVKDIMDTWTLQMNYPVVTMSRVNNTAIAVSQKRFLTSPNATDPMRFISPFNYKWKIPLTVTNKANPNFNQSSTDVLWFNDKQAQVHITGHEIKVGEWFLGNVQQFGYYRVNYDQSNWNALIKQLNTSHTVIHTINRGQIINDAWSLSKAGELDFLTALQTIEYLENEQEYAPWRAASNQFSYVSKMLMMSSVYGKYENVMKTLVTKPFQTIGMNATTTEGHTRKMLRILLTGLACRYNVESCVSTAKTLFKAWMDNSQDNTIDPDIKQAVYCTAIAEGGAEEWDFLNSQYKTSNNAAEKKRILYSLSCTKKAWILSKYLSLSLDPKQIRKQDIVSVISYVAGQSAGRDLTWNFISAKWDYLIGEFGQAQFSFANIIKGITRSFNTEFNMDQLLQFKRNHPEMSSGAQAFKQALEKTEANIRWMNENLNVISDWLNSRVKAR